MTTRRGFFKTIAALLAGAVVKLPELPKAATVIEVAKAALPVVAPIVFGSPDMDIWGELATKFYGGQRQWTAIMHPDAWAALTQPRPFPTRRVSKYVSERPIKKGYCENRLRRRQRVRKG